MPSVIRTTPLRVAMLMLVVVLLGACDGRVSFGGGPDAGSGGGSGGGSGSGDAGQDVELAWLAPGPVSPNAPDSRAQGYFNIYSRNCAQSISDEDDEEVQLWDSLEEACRGLKAHDQERLDEARKLWDSGGSSFTRSDCLTVAVRRVLSTLASVGFELDRVSVHPSRSRNVCLEGEPSATFVAGDGTDDGQDRIEISWSGPSWLVDGAPQWLRPVRGGDDLEIENDAVTGGDGRWATWLTVAEGTEPGAYRVLSGTGGLVLGFGRVEVPAPPTETSDPGDPGESDGDDDTVPGDNGTVPPGPQDMEGQ